MTKYPTITLNPLSDRFFINPNDHPEMCWSNILSNKWKKKIHHAIGSIMTYIKKNTSIFLKLKREICPIFIKSFVAQSPLKWVRADPSKILIPQYINLPIAFSSTLTFIMRNLI